MKLSLDIPQHSTPIFSTFPVATHPQPNILPHIHIIQIDISRVIVGRTIEEAPGEAGFFSEEKSAIDLRIGGVAIHFIVFVQNTSQVLLAGNKRVVGCPAQRIGDANAYSIFF